MKPLYAFSPTITGSGNGTSVLKQAPKESVSVATRGIANHLPALSTVCVYIPGGVTASVKVVSNPFDDAAKDKVLTTLVASGEYVVASSQVIIVDVASTDGAVSVRIVPNED